MAIYRIPIDDLFGQISPGVSVSDTSMTSSAFANLGAIYSTTVVTPITLKDDSLGVWETVWITGHTAGSTSVTVQRGKEGTTARAWPSNTAFLCAPTASRDALGAVNSGAMPTDAHVGYRGLQLDTGLVMEQTYLAGFQPSVGLAKPGDVGPDFNSANPPNSATILYRAGRFTLLADANGRWTVNYRTPFPTQTGDVVVTPIGTYWLPISVFSTTVGGFVLQGWNDLAGNPVPSGKQLGAFYMANGW